MATDLRGPALTVARAISRYLRVNPLACDTSDGIARWWLGGVPAEDSDLAEALGWLQRAGLVEATTAADGRVRYRRAALGAGIDAAFDRLILDEPSGSGSRLNG
jgi:hypothetical protein